MTGMRRQPIVWFLPMFFNCGMIPRDVDTTRTKKPIGPVKTKVSRMIREIIEMQRSS